MSRLRLASFVILIGSAALIARLFYIQVVQGDHYQILAEKQRGVEFEISADRGRIFASGGLLATNEEAYRITADPQSIEDSEDMVEKLLPILWEDTRFLSYNMPPSGLLKFVDSADPKNLVAGRLIELLSRKEQLGVDLARKIPAAQVAKIKALQLPGLSFFPDDRRFYPEGNMASSLLGFVAFDQDGERGYNGLEGYYDGDLRGRAGSVRREYNEERTEPILVGESSEVEPQNGADLYLTINRGVQEILERKIAEGVERYRAQSGSFVVLDPQTGHILAMGNYPSFDPGNFSAKGGPASGGNPSSSPTPGDFRNLSIASTYEPGSIMKPIMLSAGFDSGKIDPAWTFNDTGPLRIGSSTINTWDGKHWGEQNIVQLLQKSNNIGAAEAARAIERETLRSYFLNFGFGARLGIDLSSEEAGLVKELKDWRQIDLATAGFGQGIGVTALQMTSAYAAIANGGILMKPMVVERLVDQNGRQVSFSPEPIRRVISLQTAKVVAELARSAVEGGESIALRNLNYRVAGKTGTAQIPVGDRYDPHKTNVTFIGFPFKSRQFVMLIRLEEPTTLTYSATTVVPLWVEAFREIAPLFGISPDR